MQCLHPDGRELVTITIDADNGNTTIRVAIHLRGGRVGLEQVVLLLVCGVRVDVWAARGPHARFSPGKDRAARERDRERERGERGETSVNINAS
jgi:hypothetical protein